MEQHSTVEPTYNYLGIPGTFNSTCPVLHTCIQDLHLTCVDGYCRCEEGYSPDSLGGCKNDMASVVVTWISRIVITAFVLFICVIILYLIFSRGSGRDGREGDEALLENEGRDDRTCWYDAPPPYVEVVQPPPSYHEAVSNAEKAPQTTDVSPADATDSRSTSSESWLPYAIDTSVRDFARTSCDFDVPDMSINPPYGIRHVTSHCDDVAIHI